MDSVLQAADFLVLDSLYARLPPAWQLEQSSVLRQAISLYAITISFIIIFYFSLASLSLHFYYDKSQMQHPRYLKNQVSQEIAMTVKTFIPTSALTMPWFLGEVRGWSRLYDRVDDHGWLYLGLSAVGFLLFTDMCIYWIHRALHHPLLYARIHKPHHKWLVPTPFASHAFHFFDGYVQSLPYHVFVYLFPMHKYLYLALFLFVNVWTVSIHDGMYETRGGVINSAAHHTIHHLQFNYNYGQYFTLWDRVGNTYRAPTVDMYKRADKLKQKQHDNNSVMIKEE